MDKKHISKIYHNGDTLYVKDAEARETMVSGVSYDTTNKKIVETINGVNSDVVSVSTIKSDLNLTKSDVSLSNVTNDAQVKRTEMGVASGVATLDSAGKVPASQLPSYVDDVVEYASRSAFPETGETGKIYVDIAANETYRWSGSQYVIISDSQVQANWNTTDTTSKSYIQNKPTNVSAFTNDAGYLTEHQSLDNYYNKTQTDNLLEDKLDTLVSGTNIKTINNNSLLGSGNIDIQTGGTYTEGNGIDITNDEISVKAGSNLSFDANGNLNATDTTYSVMGGSGVYHASGLVPDPGATAGTTKYLREDGTWQEVSASPEVQIGGSTPSSDSDIKLFIDESADDTVEVYTKAQADGQFVAVVNKNTEPTESTLTYTSTDGTTKSFKVGDEVRIPDAEADNGYTFYKLYALTTEGGVTTATWDKLGAGGSATDIAYDTTNKKITKTVNGVTSDVVTAAKIVEDGLNPKETVKISLTQINGDAADLIGATVTVKDDNTSEVIYSGTWNGSIITTQVNTIVHYTVSVGSVTGYLDCPDQSYYAGFGERTIEFQYRVLGAYIEATDGILYTSSTWGSSGKTANAIVVLTDVCKVRMALTETNLKIHSDYRGALDQYISGKDQANAIIDYDGEGNTEKIIQFNTANGTNTTSYAAPYCKAFSFIYPNGKKGCLGSLGQWRALFQNKNEVDACLTACGGAAMSSTSYWTSNFFGTGSMNERKCWEIKWVSGNLETTGDISYNYQVRPVSTYE